MPEKAMQKVWKIMPKWRPNGGQDRLKIWKYAKKGMAKIDAETWCWKMSRFWFWDHFLARSQLPTAIYPHQALEKRIPEIKNSFGLCFEWIQREYCRSYCKMHVNIIILGANPFKISAKLAPGINENRWLRRWCVFGVALGRQLGGRILWVWVPFGCLYNTIKNRNKK